MDDPKSRDYIQNFINKTCVEIEELIQKKNDGIETQWKFDNKKCSNIADKLEEMKSFVSFKSHLLLDIMKIKIRNVMVINI